VQIATVSTPDAVDIYNNVGGSLAAAETSDALSIS
jgi:hypothetical protein